MIEEDITHLRNEVAKLRADMALLINHLVLETQDTKELSKKVEHKLSYGDEPRHYKKCRKCGKKPCVCSKLMKGISPMGLNNHIC